MECPTPDNCPANPEHTPAECPKCKFPNQKRHGDGWSNQVLPDPNPDPED